MNTARKCVECGSDLKTKAQTKYCSRECYTVYWRKQNDYRSYKGIPPGTVGTIGELRVCVDLLQKGYDVFRAVSPSCSCDLAISKNGQLRRIEVRTGYRSKVSGKLRYMHQLDASKMDHMAIVLPDEIIYEPTL